MSRRNSISAKRGRRSMRMARRAIAAKHIPFGGVIVTAKLVKQHRYRAEHRLPHSPTVAGVLIRRATAADDIDLLTKSYRRQHALNHKKAKSDLDSRLSFHMMKQPI